MKGCPPETETEIVVPLLTKAGLEDEAIELIVSGVQRKSGVSDACDVGATADGEVPAMENDIPPIAIRRTKRVQ